MSWIEPNWQQDQGPMDHDVSSHYVGYGTNGSIEDDTYSGRNMTKAQCENHYANETEKLLKSNRNGFCNATFDNLLCWPPTSFNSTAVIKCFSEFRGIPYDDTQNATRFCMLNGTWSKSDYGNCVEVDPFPSNFEAQTIIYLTGYILSFITLAVAIFVFTYFKELRCLRNIIHLNLMWSYLLTNCMWIIVLIELNFCDHIAVACVFVVTLLHYFHITTFFWMFVEGLYLYILVVRTLTRESFKLRVYALIGWGTPLFFIILWAVTKSFLTDPLQEEMCGWFKSSPIDHIFQIPTLIVLFINVVFMISIMIVLVTKLRSANTLEIQQYRKAVKALAILIPLLGVTYAITIYAPSFTWIDMVRSALLSVQGFMVALFYCFLNTEVQNTVKHHFENWKTKKSLRPNRLRSSSRSKDWSPRSRTESLRFDVPRTRRITEWTLVDPTELEDAERRMAQCGLQPSPLNQTKENLSYPPHKESFNSSQPLLNQNSRRFGSESSVVGHQSLLEQSGRKYASEMLVNQSKDSTLGSTKDMYFTPRKESLVKQPLLEENEESPTNESGQTNNHQLSFNNLPKNNGLLIHSNSFNTKDVSVLINHKGQTIVIPTNQVSLNNM